MRKIRKDTAKKIFCNCNQEIWLIPCKMRIDSYWFSPCMVNGYAMSKYLRENETIEELFNRFCNEYAFYNCNPEMGKSIAFYVDD